MDRRGSSIWFYLAIAALAFSAYSLAMAAMTADDCNGFQGRHWAYIPPEWECTGRPIG
jgi:hypothetical protein